KTIATWRRLLLVPFDITIEEDEQIKDLADQLKTELPGILIWALEGLFDLNLHGGFVRPGKSRDLLEDYRRDSDPARAFLLETYSYSPNGYGTTCSEVYEKYTQYCQDNNYRPMGSRLFGKQVYRIFPDVKQTQPGSRGNRIRTYEGLVTSVTNETPSCG
ncbi:unnamed protein product, partial [marine sediment metagenome]